MAAPIASSLPNVAGKRAKRCGRAATRSGAAGVELVGEERYAVFEEVLRAIVAANGAP
jgi:hypothetical protein